MLPAAAWFLDTARCLRSTRAHAGCSAYSDRKPGASSSLQLTAEEVAILQKIKTAKGKGSLTGRMQAAQDARMLFPCPLIVYMHQPIVFAVVQQRNAQMLEAETAQQESQTNQTNISSLDEEEQALAAATRSRARSTALGMS